MDDITIERVRGTDGEELRLSGEMRIAQAAALKEALLEALESAEVVRIDLSGVTSIDLTGLQILCAAHQGAQKTGKGFSVNHGSNDVYMATVANAGFQRHVGCSRDNTCSCIWIGGEY